MATSGISRKTIAVGVTGIAAAIVVLLVSRYLLATGSDFAATVVADVGELLISGTVAAIVWSVALGFGRGEAVRRQWTLIATGVTAFALGDLLWAIIEISTRTAPPFPGTPDIFYVAEYAFLGGGVIVAAYSYRGLVNVRWPAVSAVAVAVILFGVLWFGLLGPIVADATSGLGERLLSAFYPTADVFLEVLPALFVVLVARALGRGRFGWPWYLLAAGLVICALSDSGYAWEVAQNTYKAGDPIDAGLAIGHVLIATGALLTRDVFG